MTDREQLHQLLNERFPRFAQHLPFDQRDAIVQLIQAGPTRAGSAGGAPTAPNDDFAKSFDARVWAKAFADRFCLTADAEPSTGAREATFELMTTWFANAIMRGYDDAASRVPSESPPASSPEAPTPERE